MENLENKIKQNERISFRKKVDYLSVGGVVVSASLTAAATYTESYAFLLATILATLVSLLIFGINRNAMIYRS